MLWEVDVYPAANEPNREGARVSRDAQQMGLATNLQAIAAHGWLIEGELTEADAQRLAKQLLADPITERVVVGRVSDSAITTPPAGAPGHLVYVLPKPGVMDPVALSTQTAATGFGVPLAAVRTFRKYWLGGDDATVRKVGAKLLANDAIEQIAFGPLKLTKLDVGGGYTFKLEHVAIRSLDDEGLAKLSKDGQLYLSLTEMQTIRDYFRSLDRDPTDVELETVAQTWSEHCSHKTLAGRIRYRDEKGERSFKNMLKETIFAATVQIREQLGANDWCVSVFKDNAGVVTFDDDYHVVFKVETHNHPSALEPYGGANTGLGGVIRDPLGTGLGAKPFANTNVFCFAPPDVSADELPPGVLHPQRVINGVVSGVRDYGNRMGIPTVNGAVYFDPRYLGNPLVYCGNAGIIPKGMEDKSVAPGDYIVALGGRTGRDGIHGATFSSAELTQESESLSGGAVQIGNAIVEKMVADVLLAARDRGLYRAVTDCGAGGFSSAVGEMGEECGAEVWLEQCPLKYAGLSYTEIWISEAQERMVLAVPPENWAALAGLCDSEGVEATQIGVFTDTKRLLLKYHDDTVADLAMEFLHDGRPPVIREATYEPQPAKPFVFPETETADATPTLLAILGSLNVCSKEWIIRQYDHEVQGGSVIKPLVGPTHDGPSDAAVVRPRLSSRRGVSFSVGMNPHFGDFDPYDMAASAIDEAVRNCVAVGSDPTKIAILDNFCWGNTDNPTTLGTLVRAALACHDMAVELQTPFISGKDSLNNEFRWFDSNGKKQSIAVPSSLLISAMGQVDDVSQCVTMDLKAAGNLLYQVGVTRNELGGSHYALVTGASGGQVPQVDPALAKGVFTALHRAIKAGLVKSCHDLSEGGLAVSAAEMAFAGGLGATIHLATIPHAITLSDEAAAYEEELAETLLRADVEELAKHPEGTTTDAPFHPLVALPEAASILLFSESNTRFLVEVARADAQAFEEALEGQPVARIGEVVAEEWLTILGLPTPVPALGDASELELATPVVVEAKLASLKEAWQAPLRW